MPSFEDLRALKTRVDAAEGPDRTLDDDLWMSLCWQDHFREIARGTLAFTASLDAALALVERVLPGHEFVLHGPDDIGNFWSSLGPTHYQAWHAAGDVFGKTPTLSLISALLAALIAREEEASRVD